MVDVAVGIGLVVGAAEEASDPLDPPPACPDDRLWRTGRATGRRGRPRPDGHERLARDPDRGLVAEAE